MADSNFHNLPPNYPTESSVNDARNGIDNGNFDHHKTYYPGVVSMRSQDSDYGSTINGPATNSSSDAIVSWGARYWPPNAQNDDKAQQQVDGNQPPTDSNAAPSFDAAGGGGGGGGDPDKSKKLWSSRLRRAKTSARKRCVRSVKRACCTREAWLDRLPILKWLPRYSKRDASGDLVAGITVGLTVVPQSLAYAAIAGLPIQYGLYSSFIGCFVYCVLGTSKDVAMGTAALTSLLTASVITKLQPFTPQYAVCVCFLVGVLQLILGVLRLGILIDFVSIPVLKGFVCSGALIIAAEQIKNLLGTKARRGAFYITIYDAFAHVGHANIYDVIMSGICFAVLIALKYFTWSLVCRVFKIRMPPKQHKSADGSVAVQRSKKLRYLKILRFTVRIISLCRNAFVVILASVAACILLSRNINVLTLSEKVPPGLPPFRPPPFSFPETNRTVVDLIETSGGGIGILALLSLLINVSVGKALGARNGYYIDATQEFLAVGIGNILSSFVGSYPTSTSFSRASLNSESGVRTPAAGLLTGGIVILALSFLSPYFAYIPKAALGAVIVCAVLPLFESDVFMHTWRVNKIDLLPLLATMIGAFMLGSEYGIVIGVVVSLILVLYANARPKIDVSSFALSSPGSRKLSAVGENMPAHHLFPKNSENFAVALVAAPPPLMEISIVTPYGLLNFPTADHIRDLLNDQHLPAKTTKTTGSAADAVQQVIIVDASHISHCDYTSVCAFRDALGTLKRRDVRVVFVALRKQIAKKLSAAGIKPDTFPIYKCLEEAKNALLSQAQQIQQQQQKDPAAASGVMPTKISVARLSVNNGVATSAVDAGPVARDDDDVHVDGAADVESVSEFVPTDMNNLRTNSPAHASHASSENSDVDDSDDDDDVLNRTASERFARAAPSRGSSVFVVPVDNHHHQHDVAANGRRTVRKRSLSGYSRA